MRNFLTLAKSKKRKKCSRVIYSRQKSSPIIKHTFRRKKIKKIRSFRSVSKSSDINKKYPTII